MPTLPAPTLTVHRRSLGEDGDGSFGHPLLTDHGRDLGSPAVRAHPQEVTRVVAPFGGVQDSAGEDEKKKKRVLYAYAYMMHG